MELMTKTPTQLIKEAIPNGLSYQEYRLLTEKHAIEGTNTGPEVTESLANYTQLNHRRMKRLDKTLKLSPEIKESIKNYSGNVSWLVLTESWCGDAAQSIPVMQKLVELNDAIDLKIVLRDENLELMDQFLYNNGRSIPRLIAFDTVDEKILGDWGPRPKEATKIVEDYKTIHGQLSPELKEDLQVWYNKDKGKNTAQELLSLLK